MFAVWLACLTVDFIRASVYPSVYYSGIWRLESSTGLRNGQYLFSVIGYLSAMRYTLYLRVPSPRYIYHTPPTRSFPL